mmetsp:Transcript_30373/g.85802  ORF Transcript_30373/g.85802 Transcript_30373/m.85802 type:complete len:319 (+) Transcript_30373:1847-2803(+)
MVLPQEEMAEQEGPGTVDIEMAEEEEEDEGDEEQDLGITEDDGGDELMDPRLDNAGNGGDSFHREESRGEQEHDQQVLAFDIEPTPAIFTSQGFRRIFIVTTIIKARGAHRPSFEFHGYIIGFEGTGDGQAHAAGERTGAHVVANGLTLSLRYEPPSPKFGSKCPGLTSYRLKVSRGPEFLYSMRGLPQQMWVDSAARVAVWGKLELAFASPAELGRFLETLKHVDVSEEALLDHSALRILDSLWEPQEEFLPGETAPDALAGQPQTALEAKWYSAGGGLGLLSKMEKAVPGLSYLAVAAAAAAAGFALGYLSRGRQG